MTNPKTTETRAVAGRAKPATAEVQPAGDRDTMLAQLVSLTRSIGELAQRANGTTGDQVTDTPDDDPVLRQQDRVRFAYNFLGFVLGRRAPSVFELTTVVVARDTRTLTFTGLGRATAARIRAANNRSQFLEGLVDGRPVIIDEGDDAIRYDQRIDSIVTFTAKGGEPVAIGPCKDPVPGE
ncbi:hypothetical protein [Amycolatopsis vancoresmycina]|uniref:Uncharacterized protein n=1 Tax=Amycolatopsis vancoresmycina DSM 44592 TaxID=1292037 RepID=R1FG23_9PSEU|nr:hypothetical protein [Amycolatopsis vancoresmycina]EOD58537.1 hypothetical protein H480_43180 [Amycolatopsis vancoresmycina DSM 44592]